VDWYCPNTSRSVKLYWKELSKRGTLISIFPYISLFWRNKLRFFFIFCVCVQV